MNTTKTTAAEAAKNREIYNKLADIAREVFNHMTAEPGKVYTPADIAAAITGGPVVWEDNKSTYQLERVEPYALGAGLAWVDGYDPATVYEVAAGSFSCKVNAWKVWAVLNTTARAWSIPTRDRVTFKKNDREAVPVVASFTLTTNESRELLAATSADELRPVLCAVHLDTRRRVLVASDGYIMRVVNLGDRLTATAAAAPSYNIHKSVIKAGRAVTIYADELAEAEGVTVKCCADRFPNWAAVLTGYNYNEAGRVALTPAQFKDLKKAIAEVAKVHHADKWHPLRVTIAHTSGESVAHIWARDIDFATERESAVNIDPAAPSFSIDTDARRLAKVTTAAALYVIDPAAALLMTDPAGLTLVMPLQPSEGDKYFAPFTVAPAGGRPDLLPGVDIATAAAEITHAHRLASAAEILKNNADATADELAALVVSSSGHILTDSEARDLLSEARELMTAAPADGHQDTTTPAEVISESESQDTPAEVISESEPTAAAPAADDSEADALPVTFYDPAAGVIVWGLADELPTADGLTAESVTAADLLTIESERESAAPADGHQDTTTTDHDSESRPRALLLTITRAALRLAAVVAALLLLTFANDRPTPATATTTAADLLAPADHQDTPAEVISESESADTLTTTAAEVISEPTESEPTARPAADRPAVEKHHHGRENKRESRAELMTAAAPAADLLTADTLTAAAVVISESESQDTTTTARPLLTADELADLLALLTGTTTAESVTAAPAADDSQDTPATTGTTTPAAPAAGHQDTPATTGTTTPAASAAGCPAAVATPCPPAAPVAPVAPITF